MSDYRDVRLQRIHRICIVCSTYSPVLNFTFNFFRFGKVLWLSEIKEAPSDEVLFQKHHIRDLENEGLVSVDSVLGKTRWNFAPE